MLGYVSGLYGARSTRKFGLKEDMLIPRNAGVAAVDAEILNALLVGVMGMDRCLTED